MGEESNSPFRISGLCRHLNHNFKNFQFSSPYRQSFPSPPIRTSSGRRKSPCERKEFILEMERKERKLWQIMP